MLRIVFELLFVPLVMLREIGEIAINYLGISMMVAKLTFTALGNKFANVNQANAAAGREFEAMANPIHSTISPTIFHKK